MAGAVATSKQLDENQNDVPPSRRVPTWLDIWARGLGVDVTLFDDPDVLMAIEGGRANHVGDLCLKAAKAKGDSVAIGVFSSMRHKFELIPIITDYFGNKPSHSTHRYGDSDKDQIRESDPNYSHYNKDNIR